MARAIVLGNSDDTQLSRDTQLADGLTQEDVRSATYELARKRGEPAHVTQGKLLALSNGERDPLSMAEAMAALVNGDSSSMPGGVTNEQLALAHLYADEDAAGRPINRSAAATDYLALSRDLEDELGAVLSGPAYDWDIAEVVRIARENGLTLTGQPNLAAGAGRGDAADIANRVALADKELADHLPDPDEDDEATPTFSDANGNLDVTAVIAHYLREARRQGIRTDTRATGEDDQQTANGFALRPTKPSSFGLRDRYLTDAMGERGPNNPSPGVSGRLTEQGRLPSHVSKCDSCGSTRHALAVRLSHPMTVAEAYAQRGVAWRQ